MTLMPNQKLKENVDFALLPDPSGDQAYAVRILKGPFEGVLFRFFSIKLIEEEDSATLQYTVDRIEGDIPETAETSFDQLTTDILHAILEDFFENSPNAVEVRDENGQKLGDFDPPTLG